MGVSVEIFPHLAYSVERLAESAQGQWQAFAQGAPLPDGSRIGARYGGYLRSIQRQMTGAFSAEVYSDSPYAETIEDGAGERDLKRMLDSSMKVRISKKGKRYLIIPFRWGTPGAVTFGRNVMTQEVYDVMRALRPSRVVRNTTRESGTGAYDIKTRRPYLVAAREYRWGGRLTGGSLPGLKTSDPMHGMVRFNSPQGHHGGYLTFRVMSEGSAGWIAPPRPGRHPARTTAEMIRPIAEKVFSEAVRRDVERALGRS